MAEMTDNKKLEQAVAETAESGAGAGGIDAGAGADVETPSDLEVTAPPAEERPNRKKFAGQFSKRHKDIDFEDKEARYGALSEDADRLDQYESSGRALSGVFEKHRWMASMLEALREDDELDPITWMADNGIDILEAMEDDDYRETISERIASFQQRQVEGEQAEEERVKNLKKSAEALQSLGKSDEECAKMWGHLFDEVIDPALRGEVSKETWQLVEKALGYDDAVARAGEEGAMRARNEKIRNATRSVDTGLPPSLPQGGGDTPKSQPKKKSAANGFWEGM